MTTVGSFHEEMTGYLTAKSVRLLDLHASTLMGRLGEKLQPNVFNSHSEFIHLCEKFVEWLKTTKSMPDETIVLVKDLEEFLETKPEIPGDSSSAFATASKKVNESINIALDKLNTQSLKMIEGLFPERIDYYRAKRTLSADTRKQVDEMLQEIQEFARERQYKERDLKLITSDYLELMNMLPDAPSRKDAQQYINTLLATKGIPMKFDIVSGGMSGGAPEPINVIPLILGLYHSTQSPPAISDPQYLQTMLRSVLLALMQGTGLEPKIQNFPGDMMGLLVDGVKTGLLSSILSLSSSPPDLSKAAMQTAALSAISSLKNAADIAAVTVPPNTGYQDAIAKAAVLSLIKTLTDAAGNKDVAEKLGEAIKTITEATESNTNLSKETVKMMLLVAQSALFSMAKDSKDVDDDAKIRAIVAEELETAKEEVKRTVATATAPILKDANLSEEMEKAAEKVIEKHAFKSGLINEILANDTLTNAIKIAQTAIDMSTNSLKTIDLLNSSIKTHSERLNAVDKTLGALQDKPIKPLDSTASQTIIQQQVAAFEKQFSLMLDNELDGIRKQLATLTSRVDGLDEQVEKHTKEIGTFNENQVALNETFGQVVKLLKDRANETSGGRGWARGGDAAPASKEDPVAQAKKFRKDLDEVKKNLRGITDAFGGLQGRYDKFKSSLPHITQGKFNEDALKDDKKILGYYSYLNEDGRKFLEEIKETVADKKKVVLESQKLIEKVLDADATNPMVIKTALLAKTTIEGDYDSNDENSLGILSLMDKLYGTIKTEYDEAYSAAKAASEGIKQQREYAIREKQNQVVVRERLGGALPDGKPAAAESMSKDPNTVPVKKLIDDINKKVNTLMQEVVKKTDDVYARKLNPAMSAAVIGEPTMFMTLYNNYLNNKANTDPVMAARKLTEEMAANNLIPADVMKVSSTDKVVFVFVTIIFRMIALEITKFVIEKGTINTLPWALGAFLGIYALVFIAFVMFVNLDMYRLRILFNYINMHGNSSAIFMHLGLMWLFSFVIFMIMWNINFPLRGVKTTAISEQEKADLIYRLEVLTMIVWIFLVLMIIIME